MYFFIFLALHWYLSLFAQTVFMHRYAAHGMFSMSPFWEKFFYWYSFFTMGSSYLSPWAYGILHRLHHEHADTEDDPHSPLFYPNPGKLMWHTKEVYQDIDNDKKENIEKYKKNLPSWRTFDLIVSMRAVRSIWIIVYFFVYCLLVTHWWMWFFFPITCLMGPVHGAIINYFAHKYGYRNFKDMSNTSKNFLPVDFLMLGESYHNNHHKLLAKPNFGHKWYEIDPTYYILLVMNKIRIIRFAK